MSSEHDQTERTQDQSKVWEAVGMHQGDRLCYNDIGDKTTVRKIESKDITAVSQESSLELDSIHSGESQFKTFTFDTREDSDPDMKKCLEFWKGILEKNVKPVKCTLLRYNTPRTDIKPEKKQPINSPCDSEEMLKMWTEIYKDLQRRKLDEVKLVRKQKCNPCDEYIDEEYDRKQEEEDIKMLNNWTSQKDRSGSMKIDLNTQIKHTSNVLQTNKAEKSQTKSLKKQQSLTKTSRSNIKQQRNSTASSIKELTITKSSRSQKLTVSDLSNSGRMLTPEELSFQSEQSEKEKESEEEHVSISKENDMCGPCDVKVDECVEEVDNILEEASQLTVSICDVPCDCVSICSCQRRSIDKEDSCKCGCDVGACVCGEIQRLCLCGCAEEECICEKLEEKEGCTCGCGVDECICREMFTRSCKCGHDDCNCDLISIMSTYFETLESPSTVTTVKREPPKSFTREVQTDENVNCRSTMQQEVGGRYCVICGHYDCFCNIERWNF